MNVTISLSPEENAKAARIIAIGRQHAQTLGEAEAAQFEEDVEWLCRTLGSNINAPSMFAFGQPKRHGAGQ